MGFETKRTLLSKLRQGDDISWQEFYRIYSPLIALCGQDYNLSNADIDELIQLTIIAVFKDNKFHYQPEKGRFRDYLRTIIRHRAIDLKRKERKKMLESSLDELPELQDECSDPLTQHWEDEWKRHILRQALDELKNQIEPESYQAFELYALKEWSALEVAHFLHVSKSVVYTNKNRAIIKLREIIKEMDEV